MKMYTPPLPSLSYHRGLWMMDSTPKTECYFAHRSQSRMELSMTRLKGHPYVCFDGSIEIKCHNLHGSLTADHSTVPPPRPPPFLYLLPYHTHVLQYPIINIGVYHIVVSQMGDYNREGRRGWGVRMRLYIFKNFVPNIPFYM